MAGLRSLSYLATIPVQGPLLSKTPPRTPKRRKLRHTHDPYTPKHKRELLSQLESLQGDLEAVRQGVREVGDKTGDMIERDNVEKAQLRARCNYLELQLESQKPTGRKAVQYNPIAAFPTAEEIQKARPKPKAPTKEKPPPKATRAREVAEEVDSLNMYSMMNTFQA
ncbi:hypothetical protein EDB81DRAFT_768203 [Dactylonectria macrodidyma]|uniref:Uncharacterized protein n=1 Tax=Dactylonectria macrodidyma TaxID=307937 RepID=A0A9P9IAP9_9HYPO|nr:hypothetical protein EDB81DRAFT_768203 [Dactylonectria macrodidyma]